MSSAAGNGHPRVSDLVLEYGADNVALARARPRLTWRVAADAEDWMQSGYELELRLDGERRQATGLVESGDSCFVAWPFERLASRASGSVRVRVHATDGRATDWSDPVAFGVGLLEPEDWQGGFVGPSGMSEPRGALHLRREFRLDGRPERAILHVCALGVFVPHLNGERVGDHVLDPGWTSYGHRICSTSFDVTELVRSGANALGLLVADGWYRGRIGFNGGRFDIYGSRLGVLAQLEVRTAEGTETIVSDLDWRAARGPITFSSIYDGEVYDARRQLEGWSEAGFDDSAWAEVEEIAYHGSIEPSARPPVRRIEVIRPTSVSRRDGSLLVDFGQNLVGSLRFSATGPAGHEIVARHAEVLESGELALTPLRSAKAQDTLVLDGAESTTFEPQFTFHGFRYAELTGAIDGIDESTLEAVVVHSDLERTGWFSCSDAELTRLNENIVWSTRGNFVALPTDCPQRDERLGWTGDLQVFAPTACFLYDVGGFLASWLADVAAEQAPDGGVPNIVPDPHAVSELPDNDPAAAWADAAVVVPWVLYQRLGDLGILEKQYESMTGWVRWVESRLSPDDIWEKGWQYGDWLDPTAPPEKPWLGMTEPALVATAYAARSSQLVALAAAMLERAGDVGRYEALAARLREGFARRFVTGEGRLSSDSQTAYALALSFDLIEDDAWRAAAASRLAELVEENGFRIGTGFVGTPIICDALSDNGFRETAWKLVLQREPPSWLYPVTMGATTIWERWDSMQPDGSINTGWMTSFNHYAFGAIGDWLYRNAAGIRPAAPGYRRLRIEPHPGPGLAKASARLRTPYGVAASEWTWEDGRFELTVVVPPNTRADVSLPFAAAGETTEVGSGRHSWRVSVPLLDG